MKVAISLFSFPLISVHDFQSKYWEIEVWIGDGERRVDEERSEFLCVSLLCFNLFSFWIRRYNSFSFLIFILYGEAR